MGTDIEREMSFWDHLEELRMVLFKMLATLIIGFVGFFIALPHIYDSVIMGPTKKGFITFELLQKMSGDSGILPDFISNTDLSVRIININMASQFMTHMSLAFYLSLLFSFPILLYLLWQFVAPALYQEEKGSIRVAFLGGNILFVAGIAVGYFVVFPLTLRFLVDYQLSSLIENQLSLDSYISNFLFLIFMMGVAFELPLLCFVLSKLGLITRELFSRFRRHAIVVLIILAALITPTGDPFTLSVVFIPLYMLYELSAIVVSPAKRVS